MYINCKLKNIYMAYSLLISFFLRTHTSRTPRSGCFRPNAAVFLKPPVVMPQGLKNVILHTTQDTFAKTWHSLSSILSRF